MPVDSDCCDVFTVGMVFVGILVDSSGGSVFVVGMVFIVRSVLFCNVGMGDGVFSGTSDCDNASLDSYPLSDENWSRS